VLGLATLGTWVIVAFFFRYSSLAALAASLFAPAYYVLGDKVAWQTSEAELLAVMAMSALLLMRHKDNITRLVSGQETKIGAKKDAA
jgi:glycerol-3-phosphate acyltransferase PlsY